MDGTVQERILNIDKEIKKQNDKNKQWQTSNGATEKSQVFPNIND